MLTQLTQPKALLRGIALTRDQARRAMLAMIMVLAAILRLNGRNWDQSHYLHPDERFMTMVATGIKWPSSLGMYFDSANSPLNPYNRQFGSFVYGTFPLFLGKLAGTLTNQNVYGNFHLSGRLLSALFDLGTVLLVYAVATRLFGATAGLLGSLLMACSVLNIQSAHFFTSDSFVTMFCIAVFFVALRCHDRGRWWEYLALGVVAGLAVSSKLSALPIVGVLALPAAETLRLSGWRSLRRSPRPRALAPLLGTLLAGIGALWTFRIAQPYAFLGPSPFSFKLDPRWTRDLDYWRLVQAGQIDMPPGHQWADRTPIVFIVKNLVLWGLGAPLGVAALLALAIAGFGLVTARRWPPAWQIVLVAWPAFHIAYYGVSVVKTMRYVLPAYPFLVILAAGMLAGFWERAAVRRPEHPLVWQALPTLLVVVATAWYAIAFSGIYSRTSTRIAASEWIFANVPAGSAVLNEHWDDGLPMQLPGSPNNAYTGTQLTLYDEDNPAKLGAMMAQLDHASYIFLSSNRLYGSIPRIPERYPMTIEYYKLLFSGKLGFEEVKTFTSRPSFLGVTLNDDNAEEAFTVYDHPKVMIFRKNGAYDSTAIRGDLSAALAAGGDIVNIRPVQVGKNLLLMADGERRAQQAGGTWSAAFSRGDLANRHPLRLWYLALQLMALAATPLCWRVFRGLPDRGYAVAKTLGLLAAGYVAWILPSLHLMSFGRGAVAIGVGITALASVIALLPVRAAFVADLRRRWRDIAATELIFIAAFFAFALLRSKNPDLFHPSRGGEKFMEFAYFNAVIRSTHFPPFDPWFAGGYINYYYFGYVLLASVTRLTGIVPAVAFNLAVPTCFALLVVNTWSFVANMLRALARELRFRSPWAPLAFGLTGPLFVAVLGNLDMARRIGRGEWGYGTPGPDAGLGLGAVGDVVRGAWLAFAKHTPLPSDAFWAPSRVIDGTINEFPYFTFLFADFHPHLMALPFTAAAAIVALGVLLDKRWPTQSDEQSAVPEHPMFAIDQGWRAWLRSIPRRASLERLPLVGMAAFITGALYPLNTWDFPTYLLVVVGAFALLELLSSVKSAPVAAGPTVEGVEDPATPLQWDFSFGALRRAAIWAGATVVLGRLLFLPYYAHYEIPNSGFEKWKDASPPGQYLIIHGILLFFVVGFLFAELAVGAPRRWRLPLLRPLGLSLNRGGDGSGPHRLDASLSYGATSVFVRPTVVAAALAGFAAILAIATSNIVLLLATGLGLTALVAWHRRRDPLRLFLLAFVGLAFGLSLAVERYALRGDVGRMNTVFKFYLQVWTLFGLVAAVGSVMLIVRHRSMLGSYGRAAWAVAAVVLLMAGLAYPALATPARLRDRFDPLPRSLDGTAYMQAAVYDDNPPDGDPAAYTLASDLAGINWLLDNVKGSPVVLEGNTPTYRWGSRISVNTGLPTVIGWDWHQTQQRMGYRPLIEKRLQDVQTMLGANEPFANVRPLLDKYHVRYVYIGQLERAYYSPPALAKFTDAAKTGALKIVFQTSDVTIYEYAGP